MQLMMCIRQAGGIPVAGLSGREGPGYTKAMMGGRAGFGNAGGCPMPDVTQTLFSLIYQASRTPQQRTRCVHHIKLFIF